MDFSGPLLTDLKFDRVEEKDGTCILHYTATFLRPVTYITVDFLIATRCECGSDAVSSPRHSTWCPRSKS